MRIVCHIPVRAGSKRAPNKNIRRIGEIRVVEYAITAAVEADVFDEVWLNTDSDILIGEHAEGILRYSKKIKIYHRPEELCSDSVTSDEFNLDFAKKIEADILVMVNPVCPLVSSDTIRSAVEVFKENFLEKDTLITCTSTKMQVFYKNGPVNISVSEKLRPSQENNSVSTLNWAVTAWNKISFLERYAKYGHAVLGDSRILYDINPIEGLKISDESDFELIAALITSKGTKV